MFGITLYQQLTSQITCLKRSNLAQPVLSCPSPCLVLYTGQCMWHILFWSYTIYISFPFFVFAKQHCFEFLVFLSGSIINACSSGTVKWYNLGYRSPPQCQRCPCLHSVMNYSEWVVDQCVCQRGTVVHGTVVVLSDIFFSMPHCACPCWPQCPRHFDYNHSAMHWWPKH